MRPCLSHGRCGGGRLGSSQCFLLDPALVGPALCAVQNLTKRKLAKVNAGEHDVYI